MINYLVCLTIFTFVLVRSEDVFGQVISISPQNASIEFKATHLGVLTVDGSFKSFSGKIVRRKKEWAISGTIRVNSIATGNVDRDQTILQSQYLDADRYPEITFTGTGIERDTKKNASGNLTLKGITRPLSFSFSKKGNYYISETIILNRAEFKLDFGGMDTLIGKEIEVILKLPVN